MTINLLCITFVCDDYSDQYKYEGVPEAGLNFWGLKPHETRLMCTISDSTSGVFAELVHLSLRLLLSSICVLQM